MAKFIDNVREVAEGMKEGAKICGVTLKHAWNLDRWKVGDTIATVATAGIYNPYTKLQAELIRDGYKHAAIKHIMKASMAASDELGSV